MNLPAPGNRVLLTSISDEMKVSFIDYAMSIIVSRALPDARDGLKPVHRRILYAMHEMGLVPEKPHRKCARIVGEVLGKFHPHGDSAVYEALVRLAQSFSCRYTLVDGHGNFGSLDDNPAAMRYTEARLSKAASDLLADLDCETVDFQDNFDGSMQEPIVLPARLPGLLMNGSSGIAVGMATNIAPHNLVEVVDGLVHYIDNPDCTIDDLRVFIKGPDFPSGGTIMGLNGIRDAFETGRGSISLRGTAEIEETGKTSTIVITELPYLVGPEMLIERIAEHVKSEKLTGIADLNDESSRLGLRVVVKLKREANPDIVLNNLYKFTQLQQNFAVNCLALVNGKPELLNLKRILEVFLKHRLEVLTRKATYEKRKAEERSHIVSGLLLALADIDAIVATIRAAQASDEAKIALQEKFGLSEIQAGAILEMQLRRLTGLERGKLENEQADLLAKIASLTLLLGDKQLMLTSIKEDLLLMKAKHSSPRKSQISAEYSNFCDEDLIPNDTMMVFVTSQGYIKRVPTKFFESQNRAGRGKGGIAFREEDDLQHCLACNMHDELLYFTNRGIVYSEKVYNLPEGSRQTKGRALVSVIPMVPNETVTAIIPISQPVQKESRLILLTKKGEIKKIELHSFGNVRRSGIIAMGLDDDDELGWVRKIESNDHIMISTGEGMVIRYADSELRAMGRAAGGVKAITLHAGDRIVSCDIIPAALEDKFHLLLVTDDGYGKRVPVSEFRDQKRGGMGLIGIKFKRATSKLAGISIVREPDEVIIATAAGVILRQKCNEIPSQSRMATGVRLQQVSEEDKVISVSPVQVEENFEPEA